MSRVKKNCEILFFFSITAFTPDVVNEIELQGEFQDLVSDTNVHGGNVSCPETSGSRPMPRAVTFPA